MKKEDTIHWEWDNGEAEGKVKQKHEQSVTKKIKETEVKRNASKEEPAYTIKQAEGDKVVKSASELKKGRKNKQFLYCR